MDNKYDYECAPFITTSTMLGHPRTKKNTRPKSKIQHLRLYQYLLILELVNIFAFICTYFALTKEGELRKYGTDDCRSQSVYMKIHCDKAAYTP